MLMVVFYSLHLFTVNYLLSNPDFLLAQCANHHQSKPKECTDSLLILSKKIEVERTASVSDPLFFGPCLMNVTHYVHPSACADPAHFVKSLSADNYKLYRLLNVFLI